SWPFMKKTGCALLFLFLALCASVFFNLVFVALLGAGEAQSMTTSGWRAQMQEITLEDGKHGAGKIAVIPVQGVIHTAEQTEVVMLCASPAPSSATKTRLKKTLAHKARKRKSSAQPVFFMKRQDGRGFGPTQAGKGGRLAFARERA
ncbi:MAG: hypothetical protein ACKOEI_05445, partial [Chthoniobacterales bacterium]